MNDTSGHRVGKNVITYWSLWRSMFAFHLLVCRRLVHCASLEFLCIVGEQDLQLKSRAASPLTGKTVVTVPGCQVFGDSKILSYLHDSMISQNYALSQFDTVVLDTKPVATLRRSTGVEVLPTRVEGSRISWKVRPFFSNNPEMLRSGRRKIFMLVIYRTSLSRCYLSDVRPTFIYILDRPFMLIPHAGRRQFNSFWSVLVRRLRRRLQRKSSNRLPHVSLQPFRSWRWEKAWSFCCSMHCIGHVTFTKRRIDLKKLIGNTMLCIEVEENQHKHYSKEK